MEPSLEPICVPVKKDVSRVAKSLSTLKSVSVPNPSDLISILYQNKNETVITMPCDGSVQDEFGNVYRLVGPFELKCSDYKDFSYTTNRQTWSGNNCGGDPDPPNWPHYNGKHRVKKGEWPHCWFCYLWCLSMWRCDTTAIKLQLCEWLETESYFTINGVRLNETVVSLTINPSTDAKYGFWHNDSGILSVRPIGFSWSILLLIIHVQ
jgi:hypothetical protein